MIIIENQNKNLYLIGVFSGLALVTKTSWMLGILPIIITIIYLKKITITTLKVVLILLIVHFSFNFIWNQYKIKEQYIAHVVDLQNTKNLQ